MFEGDEVGNTAYIDLAKVQMFFFTIVAVLSYGVNLFNWIVTKPPSELSAFPVLSGGFDRNPWNKPRRFSCKQGNHSYSYDVEPVSLRSEVAAGFNFFREKRPSHGQRSSVGLVGVLPTRIGPSRGKCHASARTRSARGRQLRAGGSRRSVSLETTIQE